jgi:transcriptional regulator with XRE-family HTH domain
VQASRLADSLKAARKRLGWSREALAYHSGVSWSAIAQIETGRRKDVRLSSLAALADALDVSVDYLIGVTPTTPDLFEHRLFTYGSEGEFLTSAVPYLVAGVEQAHSVLAVTTPTVTESLHDTLVDHREEIEFAEWAEWYRSPQDALRRYSAFVAEKVKAGAVWITVVAEAGWSGQSEAEVATWTRYESLVNLTFASSPATIVCTYDERRYSPDVIAEAHQTHPEVLHGDVAVTSEAYRTPADFLLRP